MSLNVYVTIWFVSPTFRLRMFGRTTTEVMVNFSHCISSGDAYNLFHYWWYSLGSLDWGGACPPSEHCKVILFPLEWIRILWKNTSNYVNSSGSHWTLLFIYLFIYICIDWWLLILIQSKGFNPSLFIWFSDHPWFDQWKPLHGSFCLLFFF